LYYLENAEISFQHKLGQTKKQNIGQKEFGSLLLSAYVTFLS